MKLRIRYFKNILFLAVYCKWFKNGIEENLIIIKSDGEGRNQDENTEIREENVSFQVQKDLLSNL